MRAPLRSLALPLCLALAAACSAGDGADADSALARDLALAAQPATRSATPDIVPADTAVGVAPEPAAAAPTPARAPAAARPAPTPAATPRPMRPAPVAAPVRREPEPAAVAPSTEPEAPAERGTRQLGAGTTFTLTTQSAVCSTEHRPGDKIIARVSGDVMSPDGVAIPAGSLVVLEVAEAAADAQSAAVRFRVRSVGVRDSTYVLAAEAEPRGELARDRRQTSPGNTGSRTARGAIIGAVLGQVLGGDTRSTATGAAAGAVIGAATSNRGTVAYEGCFPAGGTIDVRLTDALTVVAP